MRLVLEVKGERGGVDRYVMFSREILLSSSEKALGEKEATDPKHLSLFKDVLKQSRGH